MAAKCARITAMDLFFVLHDGSNLVPRVFVPLDQRSENERLWDSRKTRDSGIDEKTRDSGKRQSRTQSPRAPWSAVWSPGETLG